ncbi:MAG: hypothetical protein U1E89_14175 [Burkholderiaceae bacterium]
MTSATHSAGPTGTAGASARAARIASRIGWRHAKILFVTVLAACGNGKEDDTGAAATVPAPCTTAPALFSSSVWPSLQSSCTTCHVQGGVAGGSRLVFAPSGGEIANYNILRDYAKDNSALLLSKSVGQPTHGGGAPYVNTSSPAYTNLSALVPQMAAQVCTTTVTPPTQALGYWQDVAFASDASVLAKAAVLFAGRNPTADEAAAAGAGASALRQTIRGYMQGANFERWLDDVGDTHFLTPGVPVRGNTGLNATDWPSAGAVLGASGVTQVDNATRNRFDAALRREGIELMKFIVRGERPFTEMVSANYTMANGILAQYLGATVQGAFTNAADDTEWRQATLPEQRLGGTREHAGVLSTHAWLSRFPTTDTNRNRHRVNILLRQFLATDITAMATRPQDDGKTFRVPVVENPACAVCHDTMDPIAAGFQNWNEANRYLPFRTGGGVDHALPQTYRSSSYPKDANSTAYYKSGDNWFRDEKEPGYAGTAMPGGYTGNKTALQWLGGQVAADQRFALGAVHFWYEGLFGREPVRQPVDTTSPQYAGLAAAYTAQSDELKAIAARFKTDQGKGAYNVKDLLVDLLLSKWGRAERVAASSAARDIELKDTGAMTMLSPAALQRKLAGLVGSGWSEFAKPYTGWALSYGDFDGVGRTSRAQSHTMMQTVTIDRLVATQSCNYTKADFDKPAASRLLFPQVALTDTPATTAGLAAITANVRYLHKWLWKDDVPETDAEVQRTLKLFTDTWADRASAPARPVNCAYNNGNDANYTGRSWAAVLAYMLGDVKFLYE